MSTSGSIKSKKTVVRSHWAKLIEDFNTSPLDFYKRVEDALEHRKVPGLESGLVEWSEGGALSAKRTYLRLVRQRIVIDVCAAPFGTGFFFSWRLGEVPLRIHWWIIAALVVQFFIAWELFAYVFGACWGTSLFFILLFGAIICLKTLVKRNLADVDAAILKVPLLSALYERHMRKLTYFRVDSMLMYEQAVHAAVMEVIDELTSTQGIAPMSEQDRKPIMRDVYGRK